MEWSMNQAPEYAPSETRADPPTLARVVGGFCGLFLTTLGVASVIADRYGYGLFGGVWGAVFTVAGVGLLLYHSVRDPDPEVRRVYGMVGGLLLVAAVGVGVFPAKPEGAADPVAGQLLLPWGGLLGFVSLLFLVPFARNETAEPYKSWAQIALLGTGGLLCAGSVLAGLMRPDQISGTGLILGLLGVAFLGGYFSVTDPSDGLPYWAAVGLGVLGAAAAVYAVGRVVAPTVLFDGPAALRKPNQALDWWKVGARVALTLLALGGLLALRSKTLPNLLKYGIAAVGVGFAGVFVVGSFTTVGTIPPKPFLVPGGLILLGLGVTFLAVSLGVTVDHPLVVLTRRELAAYFYSPIVYIVLFGAAVVAGIGYWFFLLLLNSAPVVPEPILANHDGLKILTQIAVLFVVPALTMRAFSEETRTGTLEVLLTAPVGEWTVVLSKFLPALLVLLLTWVPSAIYLVALWVAGGVPFDVRPLLSYYLAVAVSGAAFVGMGVFFSSLTRNQLVAAVLTFAGMFGLLMSGFLARRLGALFKDMSREVSGGIAEVMGRVGYVELWDRALAGQLEVSAVVLNLSMAVLWLFLTTKVLEARKWS
jgi:hypothetical protein